MSDVEKKGARILLRLYWCLQRGRQHVSTKCVIVVFILEQSRIIYGSQSPI